jgi:serine/threonine-protein phosphatase 2A regulatory subunit A
MADIGFDPLEFFKEEIFSNDKVIRIEAIEKVCIVASAIGPRNTVDKLVNELLRNSMTQAPISDDEEFLYLMAKRCVDLENYVRTNDSGKSVDFLKAVIPLLASLAEQEETVVHDAAVQSLSTVMDSAKAHVPEHLFPVLHQLANKDWFTGRVAACGLFPCCYKHGTEDQKSQLRKLYGTLAADDTPMVRRAAANKLKDFVVVVEKQGLLADVIPTFRKLCGEETQDTIRIACIQTALAISNGEKEKFSREEMKENILQVITDGVQDRSWRVRLTIAKNFDKVLKYFIACGFSSDDVDEHLLPCLFTLLKEQEQDVRTEAVKVVESCVGTMTPKQLEGLVINQFPTLVTDVANPVRAAVANILGPVARALGREVTGRILIPQAIDLMKDEFHDVRLNTVKHAGELCRILDHDAQNQNFLSSIQALIMDNQWRVRRAVIEQVPELGAQFGQDMFQQKLESLFISSLSDSVHNVRLAAIEKHKEIAQLFGQQWTVSHLVPKLTDQYSQNSGYSHRVTTLLVLSQILHVMTVDQIVQLIVPLLVKATLDTVLNVRFCACQQIEKMLTSRNDIDPSVISGTIKPALENLASSPDSDVSFYSSQALKACG